MRKFSSYGPLNNSQHYYAPRESVIDNAYMNLIGDDPQVMGHYVTVWAPRQTGKTWIMQQVVKKLKEDGAFDVGLLSLQSAKTETSDQGVLNVFIQKLRDWFKIDLPDIDSWQNIAGIFSKKYFKRPVILLIDEFDSLPEDFLNKFANEFRDIHISRQNETDKNSSDKNCLLHGLALIGVRSVLGIENTSGSPFNVQRSIQIPNLIFEEVDYIFKWCEKECKQNVRQDVIDKIYYEFNGQPGLTCRFGELLTEGIDQSFKDKSKQITLDNFEEVYEEASHVLPDNNILNIISKVEVEPYQSFVLDMFRTDAKIRFSFDNKKINYLYMNGIITREKHADKKNYVRFSCPYVQTRLFNYFSDALFSDLGTLVEPFENINNIITDKTLNIINLMRRYEAYLKKNRDWLLQDAPRRKDLRVFEAVFHFNLYMYLQNFLGPKNAGIYPEFPTGNGKIDIIVKYAGKTFGIEVKSYTDENGYKNGLAQAALYGKHLKLEEIYLVFFVEYVDSDNREKYEAEYSDKKTGVKVLPVFIETGK